MTRLAFLLLLLTTGACGPARRSAALESAPDIRDASLAKGQVVFDRHCHSCHPGGAGGLGPALNDKPLPREAVAYQVRNGVGTMPGFPATEISVNDLSLLIDYVLALREGR